MSPPPHRSSAAPPARRKSAAAPILLVLFGGVLAGAWVWSRSEQRDIDRRTAARLRARDGEGRA